jgi:hypothetical protein
MFRLLPFCLYPGCWKTVCLEEKHRQKHTLSKDTRNQGGYCLGGLQEKEAKRTQLEEETQDREEARNAWEEGDEACEAQGGVHA